jgi:hypothetical protein
MGLTKELFNKNMEELMVNESMRPELHFMEQEYIHYHSKTKKDAIYARRKEVG